METVDLASLKAAQEAVHGAWTAHNVRLGDDLYAIAPEPTGDEAKLRRIVQIGADLARKPISELRVLDLACLEGMYALEFASRGAQVTAIEGRESNLAKARFAGEALGVEVDWILGDVRSLDRQVHGEFDLVLCLGILYHLDAPDVFEFVRRIRDVCRDLLVIDTHVAPLPRELRQDGDRTYWGESLFEHDDDASESERLEAVWSSLDNPRAFAPTRSSLLNLLADAGFSSAFECLLPPEPTKPPDRVTLVARASERVQPLLTPAIGWEALPETNRRPSGRPSYRVAQALPAPVKARLRHLLGVPTAPRR